MNLFGWCLDPVYLLVVVITLVVSIAAQLYVSSGFTGRQAEYAIVNRALLGGSGDLSAILVETPDILKRFYFLRLGGHRRC